MLSYLTFSNAFFTFMVFVIVYGVCEMLSNLTKGVVSGMVFGAFVFIGLYWSGIMPADAINSTSLPAVLSSVIIPLLVTNLGTLISLEDMLKEWKTVVVALFSFVGLALFAYTIGIMLFGREYSLVGACPISGGTIAALIAKEAADAAGKPELGAYSMLLCSLQSLISMPVAGIMLRREALRILRSENGIETLHQTKGIKFNIKVIPDTPEKLQSVWVVIGKLSIVAVLAGCFSGLTNDTVNVNISYLVFGILFCELGFLEKNALTKAGCYGFATITLFTLGPASYGSLTPDNLLAMAWPIFGMLIFGAISLGIFAAIAGKVLGYSMPLSFAIGTCAMMGYPGTQIVTDDVCRALECTEEERAAIKSYILPKMLVGGFTTVTVASVAFAGIVAPTIFK